MEHIHLQTHINPLLGVREAYTLGCLIHIYKNTPSRLNVIVDQYICPQSRYHCPGHIYVHIRTSVNPFLGKFRFKMCSTPQAIQNLQN